MPISSRTVASLVAVISFNLLVGCVVVDGPGAQRTGTLTVEPGQDWIEPRVLENGYYWTFGLEVDGYEGRELPVQLFGDDRFLGEKIATATYESTVWERFRVFVPLSKLTEPNVPNSISLYVVSPDDPDKHLMKSSATVRDVPDEQIWTFLSLDENVPMSSGGRGLQLKVRLSVNGHKGEQLEAVWGVRTTDLKEFSPDMGGPILRTAFDLVPHYDNSFWKSLTINVPYDDLTDLGFGRAALISPGVRFEDGRTEAGNLHIKFHAGGSRESIRRSLERDVEQLDEQIDHLERSLRVLKGEG